MKEALGQGNTEAFTFSPLATEAAQIPKLNLLSSITLHRGTASGVSFSALTHIQAQDGRLSLLFVLQSFHQHKAPLLCVSKPGQPSRAWA